MMQKDTTKRPSAAEVLKHPWFDKMVKPVPVDENVAIYSLGNLKKFKGNQKLQSAVMTFIASQFTSNDERAALEKMFQQLDTDKSGTLSKDELL